MDMDWQQQHVAAAAGAGGMQQFIMGTGADPTQQMSLMQKLQQQQQQIGSMPPLTAGSYGEQPSQRIRRDPSLAMDSNNASDPGSIPRTITSHTHLLERNDVEGNRLRAYYRLSVDELFRLPLPLSDEEYCAKWNLANNATMTPSTIPGSHLAALSASRFAEVALGAIVHQEISLAMELCNAVVHCLRECVQEPVHDSYLYEVTRAYFLLGVFRAYRGDMERYFKYRRVAMSYAGKLPVRMISFAGICVVGNSDIVMPDNHPLPSQIYMTGQPRDADVVSSGFLPRFLGLYDVQC